MSGEIGISARWFPTRARRVLHKFRTVPSKQSSNKQSPTICEATIARAECHRCGCIPAERETALTCRECRQCVGPTFVSAHPPCRAREWKAQVTQLRSATSEGKMHGLMTDFGPAVQHVHSCLVRRRPLHCKREFLPVEFFACWASALLWARPQPISARSTSKG